MAKQVIDVHVSKGMTVSQSNEHKRNRTEKGKEFALSRGNYDPSREHLNFEVVKGEIKPVDKTKTIPQQIASILRERGITDPNMGLKEPMYRTVVNFIFGGSRERMRELAFGNQQIDFEQGADNSNAYREKDIEEWAKDVYKFVADRYGEKNIAAFIVHLDELNPHIHCTLLPIENERFAYKKIFAGKDKYEFSQRMKQLHNDFAEVNSKWGMERGSSISETGARHRTTEEYRRHLTELCTSIEQEITQHQKALSDLNVEIRLAERRVKGLSTMVDNLNQQRLEKENELLALQEELLVKYGNEDSIRTKMEMLNRELSSIQSKLADKQDKLLQAERTLSLLKDDLVSIGERRDELKSEAIKYSRSVHSNAVNILRDVMLENVVKEHRNISANFGEDDKSLFDNSLINDLAERSSEVMHCATLLFLNLIDDATTFAESNGGGGTQSDLKWGRNEDEDDRNWARRCMAMASKMMKPKYANKPKR